MHVWLVAVPSPLRYGLSYLPPAGGQTSLQPGMRVRVPLGNREVVGVALEMQTLDQPPNFAIKPISEVLDVAPLADQQLFAILRWAAHYYLHPIGDVMATALPTLLRKGDPVPEVRAMGWQLSALGHGLTEHSLKRAPKQQALANWLRQHGPASDVRLAAAEFAKPLLRELEKKQLIEEVALDVTSSDNLLQQQPLQASPQQRAVMDAIEFHQFQATLIHGETGSGKTEVYLQLVEKALRYGKQALVLIPEIGLAPQTERRFRERFAADAAEIVTLHSGLTDRERLIAWTKARDGIARIVLGTRSAIFTPFKALGIVVVDEEHDAAFKQQEGFRYSARDLAIVRAQRANIPVVLGSATPSLESLYNADGGRYRYHPLPRIAAAKQLPWQLIDLKHEQVSCGIGHTALEAIRTTLNVGQQVLVFLNRRGYAPALSCHQCGWVAECSQCDARYTVHKARRKLICHHCETKRPLPDICPKCQQRSLQPMGEGTERAEEYLQQVFADFPLIRVDRDMTRSKKGLAEFYALASSGRPAILLGTQMLAKGHHFPNVTLVLIVDADSGLFSPDFRAPERMAQLLTQVAGRAGRGDHPGSVLVQSWNTDHPLLQQLINQNYTEFSTKLLAQRSKHHLPPATAMALWQSENRHPEDAMQFLAMLRNHAERICREQPLQAQLVGPLPAPMERKAGFHRFHLQVLASNRGDLHRLCKQLVEVADAAKSGTTRWWLTVDPVES